MANRTFVREEVTKPEVAAKSMTTHTASTYVDACANFVSWLDQNVTSEARGDTIETLDVNPSATFWLGRLACEEEVSQSQLGDRAERLDPCAIGIRVRPSSPGPWSLRVRADMRAWVKDESAKSWRKLDKVRFETEVQVNSDGAALGSTDISRRLAAAGAPGLSAEVRIEVEIRSGLSELVVQLVNTSSVGDPRVDDSHLYETQLAIAGIASVPFALEALPDSFRYDRAVDAYGINVGVISDELGEYDFITSDNMVVDTKRPVYWNSPDLRPDLSFDTLHRDPVPSLSQLVDSLEHWNEEQWCDSALDAHAVSSHWSDTMRAEAGRAAIAARSECGRIRRGLKLLQDDSLISRAFRLMNRAIAHSSRGNYDSWRPFQVGFLLSALAYLDESDKDERDVADTVWFATGGGKTETYLGLLVTTAFYDRLSGKTTGVTAWSRFPLRLLSLQQTQRFADAMAGAELVRRTEGIKGDPFSIGFLVGKGGTPNKVVKDSNGDDPDPDSPGMPEQYQVLLSCPFCFSESLAMRFNRRLWMLDHRCTNSGCPWPERALPFYIVDTEIYRVLPTVVLGTLDKAASVSLQQAMRGLVGPPISKCSEDGHGYAYSPRRGRPNGCLVPDCTGSSLPLPMVDSRYAPTLRLQDELHLLRDSLGAVDSHYESLLDHLQAELGGNRAKVIASSATLSGHSKQIEVLYRRKGRVFPQQGVRAGDSFWSTPGPTPLRRYVAVAPRGVTLDHVSDRTVSILQESVRRLIKDPIAVCREASIDPSFADRLVSDYGTNTVYGTSLYDVEAADRSLASNTSVGVLNSVQLTGQTDFDDVRDILGRLESPEEEFEKRIHAIAASSMLSHGVDVSRLNTMVMLGLPLSAAEFIQTTARVGRTHPGLVYVLHKIGRERDAQTFRHFPKFVSQGDRFVDPIPITRRSRRVLRLTLPGLIEARRLDIWEPRSLSRRLTTLPNLRDFVEQFQLSPASEREVLAKALGFTNEADTLLTAEIDEWLLTWFRNLADHGADFEWPSDLCPNRPMMSLRDVETTAPIFERRS
ncbi:helicase-related protein [Gordonia alkanivorans]|uniref:helicase-related protein n=1 Tax=Gordonia alkanivorans TaxID=84096 RepID=UPI0024487DE6|nr:helicase-related protein [Gordonia alkanivorans]MDH3010071.1 helicase-related protein [Gordonia alkanivorans]